MGLHREKPVVYYGRVMNTSSGLSLYPMEKEAQRMGNCVIFCAGDFTQLLAPLTEEDYVIAADGGFAHTRELGITPNETLGDFDSLGYAPRESTRFPVEKDDTDTMLAVRRGLELGYRNFFFYGGLEGPRLDHTLANLQTLLYLKKMGAEGYFVGKNQVVTAMSREKLRFSSACTGIISLFCLSGQTENVQIKGLQYPLQNGALTSDFPLGISNHFVGETGEISATGELIVFFDRGNPLPERIKL